MPSMVASDWSAASIVACMPAGSEMLPVRTSPSSLSGQALEEAVAAQGQSLVAHFLVEADGVLDAGRP